MARTKLDRRIAYHPQTDGHTEVVNRGVEIYLRCFCGKCPKEWVCWLHWAKSWYNATYQRALGVTPFQAMYGRVPPPLISYGEGATSNSTLDEQLVERGVALGAFKEHLREAQEKMKKYVDAKRREVEYQVGDKVFLKLRSYRKTSMRKKRNEKLLTKFFRPYKLLERIGLVAYSLELPKEATLHTVFHVSQSKKLLGEHVVVQPTTQYLTESHDRPPIILQYSRREKKGVVNIKGVENSKRVVT